MDKSRKLAALLIGVIILTCISSRSFAQYDEGENPLYIPDPHVFYTGVVVGSNFTQVDGDNFAGYHKMGLNVGGIGYIQLKKHLALSFEILYSQKGSKSDMGKFLVTDTTVWINSYHITANYAEIPLMINYFDSRKSHFGIGVSYNRLVSSSETATTDPSVATNFNAFPFKKNSFDALAGAKLHLWKGLFLNVRFQYGIVPMRTKSPDGFYRAEKQYNNMWTVRLMYLFM